MTKAIYMAIELDQDIMVTNMCLVRIGQGQTYMPPLCGGIKRGLPLEPTVLVLIYVWHAHLLYTGIMCIKLYCYFQVNPMKLATLDPYEELMFITYFLRYSQGVSELFK